MESKPRFFALQTLMGGEPDCNSRSIFDKTNLEREVARFNPERRPWTPDDDRYLDISLKALNEEMK